MKTIGVIVAVAVSAGFLWLLVGTSVPDRSGESPAAGVSSSDWVWPIDLAAADEYAGRLMLRVLASFPAEWPVNIRAKFDSNGAVLECDVSIEVAQAEAVTSHDLRKDLCSIVKELGEKQRSMSEEQSEFQMFFPPRLAY